MIYICTHRDFIETQIGEGFTILSNRVLEGAYQNKVVVADTKMRVLDRALSEGAQIYWLWKHRDELPDVVGINHYRRYFKGDTTLAPGEVILPKAKYVNLEKQYDHFHNIDDLRLCWKIIDRHFPEYSMDYSKINVFYHYNMFIMHREDFLEYCDFVFGVLRHFCKRKGFACDADVLAYVKETRNKRVDGYKYQSRLLGFLMERLGTVFFLKHFRDRVVKEMPVDVRDDYEEKTDVLYIIGTGSQFNNEELRYSLRTLEKNVSGLGRIFIVGYIPPFINRKRVVCLPCSDPYNRAHKNMLYKMEYAIMNSDIGNDFLLSADDHFYINKCDFGHYPFYYRGMLKDKKVKQNNIYTLSLQQTMQFLESHGYPAYDFSQHVNTHCNKEIFKQYVLPLAHESYDTEYGVESMSLMLNVWLKHQPFELTHRKDHKLMSKSTLSDLPKNAECFSVNDDAYRNFVRSWLARRYPNKSKWEI